MSSNKELLTQEFFLYPKKTVASVTLTNEAITVTSLSSNPKSSYVIKLDDVIGCHVLQGNLTTLSTWYLCIFSYPLKKKVFSGHSRQRLTRSLGVPQSNGNEDTKAIAEKWKSAIKYLCTGSKLTDAHDIPVVSPRRFLVYVNPFSGSGKALQIYEKDVRRLFSEAEITHTKFKTDYAGHAKEDVKAVDLSKYDGIVIVSGDGLIHEVINGLMERDDWEEAIKTPLGVVPGGSGNALAASIVYASTGHLSTENLLNDSLFELGRGRTRSMSLMHVQLREQSFYSFLNIGWGFVADVDIESERYRFLGTARFTMGTFVRVARLHKYHGMISYVPTDDQAYFSLNQHSMTKANSSRQRKRVASTTDFVVGSETSKPQSSSADSVESSSISFSTQTSVNNNGPTAEVNTDTTATQLSNDDDENDNSRKSAMSIDIDELSPEIEPPVLSLEKDRQDDVSKPPYFLKSSLSEPLPDNWKTIEGDFVFVMPVYLSHIGDDMLTIPTAKLEEPVMYLYCLKHGISKLQLTRYFLGFEDGSHLDIGGDYVSVIPCKAFRLEPFTNITGYMTVDGELIPHEPLQASITPITARIMSSSTCVT